MSRVYTTGIPYLLSNVNNNVLALHQPCRSQNWTIEPGNEPPQKLDAYRRRMVHLIGCSQTPGGTRHTRRKPGLAPCSSGAWSVGPTNTGPTKSHEREVLSVVSGVRRRRAAGEQETLEADALPIQPRGHVGTYLDGK